MSLSAVVYRRREELPFTEEDLRYIDIDPVTGCISTDSYEVGEKWDDKIRAVRKRIGNIADVALLRAEVTAIYGAAASNTLLISRVLYNAVHGDDYIRVDEIEELKGEIAFIRQRPKAARSWRLEAFLNSMEELAEASLKHGNPILFL